MSESENTKQQKKADAPQSVTPDLPSCLPFREMFKQMAARCDCQPGAFAMPRCEEPEAPSAAPAK